MVYYRTGCELWIIGINMSNRKRRLYQKHYCRVDQLEVADMFNAADDDFFSRIKSNSHHDIPYQLRARSHTLALINKTKFLNHADFIIRLLYIVQVSTPTDPQLMTLH